MAETKFSTNNLRAVLQSHRGPSKGNKFSVQFLNAPVIIPEDLSLLCETTSFPTRSAATTEHNVYGPVYQFPYRFTFTEMSMNFYLTEDMFAKTLFDDWQEKMINSQTSNLGFYEDYTCDISIKKFSAIDTSMNAPDYNLTLMEAFPSIIGEIQLGHSLGNEVQRLPVTFLFKKWANSSIAGNFPNTGPPGRG